MPLIQRNLFPSRPSSKKGDGPSVLRAVNTNGFTSNNSSTSVSTNTGGRKKSDPMSKSSSKSNDKDAKKMKKSQSASLNSLLVISNTSKLFAGNGSDSSGSSSSSTNKTTNYDSHDSFPGSSDTSSDPNSLSSSSSSVDNMISRRKILSRSRDALNSSDEYTFGPVTPQDEDVWFNKSQLISDHIEEIVTKWDQIDDEIWAKVICMERNRRVAKAYARAPILTINGSDIGFDGHRIGLNGFKNPLRDTKVLNIKKEIEMGIKIRMDDKGNLLVKRLSKSEVFLLSFDKLADSSNEKIECKKSVVLFDMKKFQNDLLREIKSSNPNPRALEEKCFCFISFATTSTELLNTPVWIIIINLVALEMLIKILPNKNSEDNLYSLPVMQHFSSPIPPKLPPRDLNNKKPPLSLPEPDYDDELQNIIDHKHRSIDDDPYYYGLSAHVPKYNHSRQLSLVRSHPPIVRKALSKKFWPQSNGFSLKIFSQKGVNRGEDSQLDSDSGRKGTSHTLDYRNRYSGSYSNFSTYNYHTAQTPVNDNEEIYGINPSLLRKNTQQLYLKSASSPSLKNIFNRKSNKDYNNNSMQH